MRVLEDRTYCDRSTVPGPALPTGFVKNFSRVCIGPEHNDKAKGLDYCTRTHTVLCVGVDGSVTVVERDLDEATLEWTDVEFSTPACPPTDRDGGVTL